MNHNIVYTAPLVSQYKGFLLIELLVSIMIMSSLSLILAQFQGNIRNIHRTSDEYVKAMHKATNFLEEIIGGNRIIQKNGSSDDDDGYSLSWNIYPSRPIKGLMIADVYHFVTVTVSWKDALGNKRLLELATGVLKKV
jgi:Tfp pilus assembly protein PilE